MPVVEWGLFCRPRETDSFLVDSSVLGCAWRWWISSLFAWSTQFQDLLEGIRVWSFYVWTQFAGLVCLFSGHWMVGHCWSSVVQIFQIQQRFFFELPYYSSCWGWDDNDINNNIARILICDNKHVLPIWEVSKVCADFCPWSWRETGHFQVSFLRGWYGDLTAESDFDSAFNTHACRWTLLFLGEGLLFYNSLMSSVSEFDDLCLECPWQNYPVLFWDDVPIVSSDNPDLHWKRVRSVFINIVTVSLHLFVSECWVFGCLCGNFISSHCLGCGCWDDEIKIFFS